MLVGCSTIPTNHIVDTNQKVYVGSSHSNKYHKPECVWAERISPENEVWFSSKEDAETKGYVPCKVCKP